MKFFRKKKARSEDVRTKPARLAPDDFYSHHAGEAPLDEYAGGPAGGRQTHRTSRHSPARRRENNNRASSWAIAGLLFRSVLIVVLLVGGFFGLRWFLDGMADPTEKEKQQWEANESRMEKSSSSADSPAVPKELAVSPALVEQRLEQWKKTEQNLRSAEALSRRGINEEAIERLDQALRLTPDNREAQQMLVDIYMRLERYAEAVPLCIRLLDQDSRRPELQMNLLRALQASGQLDAGLVLAEQILMDQPNNQAVLAIAASTRLAQGNTDAALAIFERMLANDPKNKGAMEGCAKIYFERGAYERAIPHYLDLIRLDPQPAYYQTASLCYARQNEAGKAVVLMGQAASRFGESVIAPWLKDTIYDPIRESVEFRSFADRIVGVETRKVIEAINKRESEKTTPAVPGGGLELPKQPDLNVIKPGK